MNTVLETDRNMELSPMTIYIKMINEQEIRTGEKSKLERQVTPEQVFFFFLSFLFHFAIVIVIIIYRFNMCLF